MRKEKLMGMEMPSKKGESEEDMMDLDAMEFDEEEDMDEEMPEDEYAMSPEEMMEALEKMGYTVSEPEGDEEDPEDEDEEGDGVYV